MRVLQHAANEQSGLHHINVSLYTVHIVMFAIINHKVFMDNSAAVLGDEGKDNRSFVENG